MSDKKPNETLTEVYPIRVPKAEEFCAGRYYESDGRACALGHLAKQLGAKPGACNSYDTLVAKIGGEDPEKFRPAAVLIARMNDNAPNNEARRERFIATVKSFPNLIIVEE